MGKYALGVDEKEKRLRKDGIEISNGIVETFEERFFSDFKTDYPLKRLQDEQENIASMANFTDQIDDDNFSAIDVSYDGHMGYGTYKLENGTKGMIEYTLLLEGKHYNVTDAVKNLTETSPEHVAFHKLLGTLNLTTPSRIKTFVENVYSNIGNLNKSLIPPAIENYTVSLVNSSQIYFINNAPSVTITMITMTFFLLFKTTWATFSIDFSNGSFWFFSILVGQ